MLNYVDLVITLVMESHDILQILGACMFFSFGCTIVYRGQTYLLYGYLENCRSHSYREQEFTSATDHLPHETISLPR